MIVVTAPAGDIGGQVVDLLQQAGAPLRLIARDPAKLSQDVRNKAEVLAGSPGDADVIDRAAACPSPSHAQCPTFRRLMMIAADLHERRNAKADKDGTLLRKDHQHSRHSTVQNGSLKPALRSSGRR
ncbi:Rossmann-fold NAD(P)-binding domain-containing protein [Sphingobium ummariense]|nr:hypothetical protein [Sphingobium ummariense]